MSVETIIAIVTAGIALITSVASFTYNLIQNRKDRIQKVVLEGRIKYMYEIREGFSSFIGCAHEEAVQAAKNNGEMFKILSDNLLNGYGKIKTYIKPFYEIDKALVDTLDETYKYILALLNGTEKDAAKLKGLREDLEKKYLTYDWAYWKYIQAQKDGNYMNSDDAFDDVYANFVKEVESKNHK